MKQTQNFLKGIFKENPTFVIMLGMCPTLAVTKSLESALGMGVSVIFVLIFSNMIISAIKKIVPSEIRIPVYIVVIATLVTIVEMVLKAYFLSIYEQLGIFVSLIVVNCIILGRAEAFASRNTVFSSIIDALGMGVGFTLAISLISVIRQTLGEGKITVWGEMELNLIKAFDFFHIQPTQFFVGNVGAFLVLGLLIGVINAIIHGTKLRQDNKLAQKGVSK